MNPHASSSTPYTTIREQGWALLKNVYTPEDIRRCRKILDELFAADNTLRSPFDSDHIINDLYRHRPELAKIIFNKKYFAAVAELIGDRIVWLPECAIHRDRYAKWHKDTTEQELGGVSSHIGEEAPMLQVSTYFQNYTPEEGGGITVVPGSHHLPDRFLSMYKFDLLSRVRRKIQRSLGHTVFQKIEKNREYFDLPGKATDLAVFDIRTEHRASTPLHKPAQIKYAVFNTFGKNTLALKEYYEFMKNRPEPYYQFYKNFAAPPIIYEIAEEFDVEVWP